MERAGSRAGGRLAARTPGLRRRAPCQRPASGPSRAKNVPAASATSGSGSGKALSGWNEPGAEPEAGSPPEPPGSVAGRRASGSSAEAPRLPAVWSATAAWGRRASSAATSSRAGSATATSKRSQPAEASRSIGAARAPRVEATACRVSRSLPATSSIDAPRARIQWARLVPTRPGPARATRRPSSGKRSELWGCTAGAYPNPLALKELPSSGVDFWGAEKVLFASTLVLRVLIRVEVRVESKSASGSGAERGLRIEAPGNGTGPRHRTTVSPDFSPSFEAKGRRCPQIQGARRESDAGVLASTSRRSSECNAGDTGRCGVAAESW